jgi:thymidylate synthase
MPDYIKICIYDVNTKTESIRHIYFQYDDTAIENYDPHPAIKAAVAV